MQNEMLPDDFCIERGIVEIQQFNGTQFTFQSIQFCHYWHVDWILPIHVQYAAIKP